MSKNPLDLEVMDFMRIRAFNKGKTPVRVTRLDPAKQVITQTLTTAQTLPSKHLTDLKSPPDEIFYFATVELRNDINFYATHRKVNLFGYSGEQFITIDDAVEGRGFPLNLWAYNREPIVKYVNNKSATANVDTIWRGMSLTFEEIDNKDDPELFKEAMKLAAIVDG